MAESIPYGSRVFFIHPDTGKEEKGTLLTVAGGDMKIQAADGIVYVYPTDVRKNNGNNNRIPNMNPSKNRKSRKGRKGRKSTRRRR